jgi:hypothetical protein
MGKYLDIIRRKPTEQHGDGETSEKSELRGVPANQEGGLFRLIRFFRTFQELERRCPLHVDPADWQQAVEDGRKFLTRWGQQADRLGWTARDLFGLHPVPERPAANFRRLARYDATGLIWLVQGRPVIALTETEAAIQSAGAVVMYRKLRKPTLGPLGDSLDDMELRS